MFCVSLTSRYQVSVYRTNGPLVLFVFAVFTVLFLPNSDMIL